MVLSLSSSEDTLAAGAGQWTSAIVEMLIVREVESDAGNVPTSNLWASLGLKSQQKVSVLCEMVLIFLATVHPF